ncbi:MAG: ATP-binding protein [Anaerovoracaceae bacterium]
MYRLISKLIVYRKAAEDDILSRMSELFKSFDGEYNAEELISDSFEIINRLLDLSTLNGFDRNLWRCYLSYLIAMTETPFTLVAEKTGSVEGTVNEFVLNDLRIFKSLFDYDFSEIEEALNITCFSTVSDYRSVAKNDRVVNFNVSEKVKTLSLEITEADDESELYEIVMKFYKNYGVGELGMNKAFRVQESETDILEPVAADSDVRLEDIIGYEKQKMQLTANTEAFINGCGANNVLLYGDAGTGKSTSIKALINEYYDDGLRMIEIYKHQFRYLPAILAKIKNRNYRFIIYMDDLSFEEFEIEYKYLKAVIEGGLEVKPENVLIYATSNRRHLIRETWSDRSDMTKDDIHRSDTMQEKLSLSSRFGLTIGYFNPSREEFYEIVKALASDNQEIQLSEQELLAEADRWEMRHGGKSGRTARQFIDYLSGAKKL